MYPKYSNFWSVWQNVEKLFEEEVTLPYHLWGMKFLTCLEWFLHIQARSWQGHQPVSLGPFSLHYQWHILLLPTVPLRHFLKIFLPILDWESLLFWLWKINSHYRRERKRERTCSRGRETDCYPCQSDPAWRLSSPLIALLISSPLSLDLGQRGPSAGADFRLSFVISLSLARSLCLFFLVSPLGSFQLE